MAWQDETALPFTPTGQIFFSPIIGNEVYIIDQGSNFYKYNLVTKGYTELTSPTYGSTVASRSRFFRTLAISPDGTKLACCSEGVFCAAGPGDYNTGGGWRVEIYDIAGNTWTASKQTDFLINLLNAYTRSLVWEDNDTLWVWCIRCYRTGSGWSIKCVKYTISTDTWTSYANSFQDTAIYDDGLNCGNGGSAIKADKSVVYGGGTGAGAYECKKYTIATDSYSTLTLGPSSDRFCHAYDRDKIWYYEAAGTCQQGYIDTADNSQNDDQFIENTDRDTGYGKYGGIADDLSIIITHARSAAPELMSEGVLTAPTVTTDAATGEGAIAATLNGTLDADSGEVCQCGFEWGLDVGYGTATPTESKTTGESFSQEIGGLVPNTVYHFRALATNSAGTGRGADRSFTTALVISKAYALARSEL